jgi:hypothetical protein
VELVIRAEGRAERVPGAGPRAEEDRVDHDDEGRCRRPGAGGERAAHEQDRRPDDVRCGWLSPLRVFGATTRAQTTIVAATAPTATIGLEETARPQMPNAAIPASSRMNRRVRFAMAMTTSWRGTLRLSWL